MDIQEAVAQVDEQMDDLAELKGTYLCSALALAEDKDEQTISTWELSYYNKKEKKITQVSAKGRSVSVQATGDPTKPGEIEKLDIHSVKVDAMAALHNARELQKTKFMQPVQRIFLSLQVENGKTIWSVSFISKLLSIVNIKLDAKTGDVLSSSLKSFLHGKGSAE